MSSEQKESLPEKSTNLQSLPKQAELDSQRAEIVHPDGSREQVELRSERMWSGILPRPEDFAKFGDVVPTAPERLLRMAELEQQHRMEMERLIVPGNQKASLRGQILGASISALALILAAVSSYLGAPSVVSISLVGVPVLSVARSLVTAFRSDSE